MSTEVRPLGVVLLIFVFLCAGNQKVSAASASFNRTLTVGSYGTDVREMQQILNQDPTTRIGDTGPGSPGQETMYFGPATKAAVIRFQAKYASEVLAPAGLTEGTGYVGSYTRAKLSTLSTLANTIVTPTPVASPVPPPTAVIADSSATYLVTDSEKTDIYAGDKMIADVRNRILTAINTAITSPSTATVTPPTITSSDVPSVAIMMLTPQFGVPGTQVSLKGSGILANSVIYFGNNYIVHKLNQDLSGNFSFGIPPIPPGYYDIAIRTGNVISKTEAFVITDPKNPLVHITSVFPDTIPYGRTLTIVGSGFSSQDNIVVTNYQEFSNVPSIDGKTLTVQLTPDSLTETAKVSDGTRKIPMSLYVVNNYGFSDSKKTFTMSI